MFWYKNLHTGRVVFLMNAWFHSFLLQTFTLVILIRGLSFLINGVILGAVICQALRQLRYWVENEVVSVNNTCFESSFTFATTLSFLSFKFFAQTFPKAAAFGLNVVHCYSFSSKCICENKGINEDIGKRKKSCQSLLLG